MADTYDPMAPSLYDDEEGGYFDCSGLVNRFSMKFEVVEREGNNGGLLCDGRQIRDILARKIRLSWTLNSVSVSEYARLAGILGADTVIAEVFDPSRNGRRLVQCVGTLPAFELAFTQGLEPMTKAGAVLVLEEV